MKVSKSNIVYANFGSLTSFYTLYSHNQVEYKCNAIEKKISLQSISHRSFISDIFASEEFKATIIRKMHRNRPNDVYLGKGNFILRSTICSIKSIELWCLCKNCQSQTFLGLCPRNCSSGKLKGTDDDVEFHGKALFGIDDGSSFANVTISYFLGIKKLLCIPNIGRANDLWQVLKNKLKLEGTVSCFFETDGYADDSPQYEKEINVERSSESILMNLIKRSQYISPKSFLLVCEYPIWHQIVTESDFSFPIERFRIREFGDLVIRQVSFPSLFLNCKRIEETDLKLEGMLMVDL